MIQTNQISTENAEGKTEAGEGDRVEAVEGDGGSQKEAELPPAETPDPAINAVLDAIGAGLQAEEDNIAPADKVQLPRFQQLQGGGHDERPTFDKRLILDLEQDEDYLKLRDEIRRQIEATKKRGEILDLSQSPNPKKENKAASII